jgi:hypothetical protein
MEFINKEDRQHTYNVTMRRLRLNIVAAEKKLLLHTVSVLLALGIACNAHAPYCHLWPVRLYNIFPHYLTNSMISEKTLSQTVYFDFLCSFV